MGKAVVYKGRQSVRDAMRILNHSRRFIILAEDENGADLPLYCSGYPHESLVADQLLKVGVAMLRKHRQDMEAWKQQLVAAGQLPAEEPATALSSPEGPLPANSSPDEGRQVGYDGLILPATEVAPPAFGQQTAGNPE